MRRHSVLKRTVVAASSLALTTGLLGSALAPAFADELAIHTVANTNDTPDTSLIQDQNITDGDVSVTVTSAQVALSAKSGGFYRMEYYGQSVPLAEVPNGDGTSRYSASLENLPNRSIAAVTVYFKATEDGSEISANFSYYVQVLEALRNAQASLAILPSIYTGTVSEADKAQITANVIEWYRAAGYTITEDNITTSDAGVTVNLKDLTPPQGWDVSRSSLTFAWYSFYSNIRSYELTVSNRGIASTVIALGQGSVSTSYDGRTLTKDRKNPAYSMTKTANYTLSLVNDDLKPWTRPFASDGDKTVSVVYTAPRGEQQTQNVDLSTSALHFRAVDAALAANPLPKLVLDEAFDCPIDEDGDAICPDKVLTDEQREQYKALISERLDAAGIAYGRFIADAYNRLSLNLPTETIDGVTVNHRYFFDDLIQVRRQKTVEVPFATEYQADDTADAGTQTVVTEGANGTATQEVLDSVVGGTIRPNETVKKYVYEASSSEDVGEPVQVVAPTNKVIKVGTKPVSVTEEIPFETVYEDDPDMTVGEERVLTEGVNGTRTVTITYTVDSSTGEVTSSDAVEEVAPVTRVIARGTKPQVTDPVDPVNPTDPVVPVDPVTPVDPTAPVAPDTPANGEQAQGVPTESKKSGKTRKALAATGASAVGVIAGASAALLAGAALGAARRRSTQGR